MPETRDCEITIEEYTLPSVQMIKERTLAYIEKLETIANYPEVKT